MKTCPEISQRPRRKRRWWHFIFWRCWLLSYLQRQFDAIKLLAATNNRKLDRIDARTKWLVTRSIQPGPLTLIGDTNPMADLITFNVALPALPDGPTDIKSGELTVAVAGQDPVVTSTLLDDTEAGPYEGPQDAVVDLSYVYVDDAGNRSDASTAQITLVDTVPPPAPGQLGVTITGEKHGEDPAPDPDPTPSESGSDTAPTPDPEPTPSESGTDGESESV